MDRVDAFYLFTGGRALRPLADLRNETKYSDAQLVLYVARGWLQPVIAGQSIFRVRFSWAKGNELLSVINTVLGEVESALQGSPQEDKDLGWLYAYQIKYALEAFETVLGSEWALADLFLVANIPGHNATDLIENGGVLYPSEMLLKVPEAEYDAKQTGKCLAFRLPTAAGFHMHRVNESVLRRYYDVVAKGKPKPKIRTIGAYIGAMEKHGVGQPKIIAALKSIKDLHRNPLLHPDDILADTEEAFALLGGIVSALVPMLKVIPLPPSSAPASALSRP